jgi:hypothetical protein
MDAEKKKFELEKKDNEIIYSRAIKAGKRIYYLDVKKSKNDDLFVAITESKKKVTGFDEDAQVTYEKHKIFLYKEDFEKFTDGLEDVINFIRREQKSATDTDEENMSEKIEEKEDKDNSQSEIDSTKSKGFFGKFKF